MIKAAEIHKKYGGLLGTNDRLGTIFRVKTTATAGYSPAYFYATKLEKGKEKPLAGIVVKYPDGQAGEAYISRIKNLTGILGWGKFIGSRALYNLYKIMKEHMTKQGATTLSVIDQTGTKLFDKEGFEPRNTQWTKRYLKLVEDRKK